MRCIAFVAAWLIGTAAASAQIWSFTISGGYSNVLTNKSDGLFYNRNGAYIDADFNYRVPDASFPLLVGGGITGSGYWDTQNVLVPGSFFGGYTLYSDFGLLELEARAAVPIALRHAPGWFVMPRIGAGLLIDDYAIDTPNFTEYFTGAAFEIRPAVQVGYSWGPGSFGAEFSYMAAWGDFGHLGSFAQELRVGLFLRFKF